MDFSTSSNSDLIWNLEAMADRQRARDFVMQFENRLCVYSRSVGQIYSNYNMFFPEDADRNLVILPNPYAFHDTFNYIDEEAVSRTGFHIIPGEVINKQGLYMLIASSNPEVPPKPAPLGKAVELLSRVRSTASPFLPVLIKGDLKPYRQKVPSLHLHRLHIDRVRRLSSFDRQTLQNTIQRKMEELAAL